MVTVMISTLPWQPALLSGAPTVTVALWQYHGLIAHHAFTFLSLNSSAPGLTCSIEVGAVSLHQWRFYSLWGLTPRRGDPLPLPR